MKNIFNISLVMILLCFVSGCHEFDTDSAAATAAYKTKIRVDMACASVEIYLEDYGSLPNAKSGLEALVVSDSRASQGLIFVDGWKRPLMPIISEHTIIGAYSVGQNAKDENGGGDDISCRTSTR
jgi:hypothetical protein